MAILPQLKNFDAISSAIGSSVTSTEQKGEFPWDTGTPDIYFPFINIKSENWDRLFPYRFLVVDASKGNSLVNSTSSPMSVAYRELLDSARISVDVGNRWEARLPITPQMMSTSTLFAIANTPALRGILEEHNGVKYKMITMSGTTGIYPARNFTPDIPAQTSIQSIFAGTLASAAAFGNAIKATQASIKGGTYSEPNTYEIDPKQTGYYHALYIEQFIEQYSIAKKRPECKSWRLVLDIPKQNTSYYVTPIQTTITQNAQKPMEWQYTFQLKVWKRITLNNEVRGAIPDVMNQDLSTYQKAINAISNARLALQAGLNTIKAVRTDVLGVANNLRQVALMIKDVSSIAATAADLPRQLVKDLQSSLTDTLLTVQSAVNMPTSEFDRKRIYRLQIANTLNENISLSQINNRDQGLQAKNSAAANPAYNMFSEPESAFSILNNLNIDQINMSQQQRFVYETELDQVRLFTVQDIKNKRNDLYNLYLDLSNKLGTNTSLVNKIYNRPAPNERPYPLSLDETTLMYALFDAIQAYDSITSSRKLDDDKVLSPMQYTKDLADEAGIDFQEYPSKILMPVPFNQNMEQIALRYLGDSKRWIEIATLNALREPYIDETGFIYKLLSNADGRQFTINTNQNLYVGQKILLGSLTVAQFTRRITNIEKITANNYLIKVDGLSDLNSLTLVDQAYMKAYLPGTVNSQDMLFIPSNQPADPLISPTLTQGIPHDSLALTSKVDFLLTDNMDVALDSNGDFRASSGVINLIQAVKLKFLTIRGSMLQHPDFGLSLRPGMSVADINNNQLFNEINSLILQDPRFSRLLRITVDLNAPQLLITLLVEAKNNKGVIPISFVVPR